MTNSLEKKKRCLLIGNDDYKEGHRINYCSNNLTDLEEKLNQLDFQVTIGRNLTCDQMDLIIENFVQQINANDLILFYYCGYGIHYENCNYFIPIDNQQIEDPKMFEYRTINVQPMIEMINERRPSASIFLFDCSRSYFILDKIDLRNSIDYGCFNPILSLPNCLFMYSSEANQLISDKSINGRNNLFVHYLLQYIEQINLPIEELMDLVYDEIVNVTEHQISPYKVSDIKKNLFFNYQIQTEISQKRSIIIENLIKSCQNGSFIDLRNKQIIDRDLKVIIEEVLMKNEYTRLWLDGNHLTSMGASSLSNALNSNHSLERLYLAGNSFSDIGIKYLAKTLSNANKTLKILGLQQNHITDLGIEHLAQMIEKNQSIISLSLDSNLFTDKGVKLLTNALIHSNSTIQYLGLANNKYLTDVSFDYLSNLIKFNQTINEISLYHCSLTKLIKDKLKKLAQTKRNFQLCLNNWNE